MSSTTQILNQIEADFKKQKSLQNYLPNLLKIIDSDQTIVFEGMNSKQKLTQLQTLIQKEINSIKSTLAQQNIDLEVEKSEIDLQSFHDQEKQNFEEQAGDFQIDENLNEQSKEIEEQQLQYEVQRSVELDFSINEKQKDKKKISKIDSEIKSDNVNEQIDQQFQQQNEGQNLKLDELLDDENDVGLYGEELNQQDSDMENYQNQFDEEQFQEFQKDFGQPDNKNKNLKVKKNQNQNQNPDDFIEDNFDYFRQIELQNQKIKEKQTPNTQLDNQIDRLENQIIGKKDWAMRGQITAKQRPSNSLLEYDLQFTSGIKYSHEITEERNAELEELIKKRILNEMYDDRTRYINVSHIREHFGSLKEVSRQKSQMGLGQIYESQFKNFLGIGQNKNEKLKTQILNSFKQLNFFLDSLSNFSFVPKPTKDISQKGQSEAIIVEEKVPLTLWNGQKQIKKDGKLQFESEKQVNNQAKRRKNKRIARQRKKQQISKRLNKKIEYGGITKFQAQAKKKAQMNSKPLKIDGVNMKYNKSSSFFKNINQSKEGKPNPDISKMKI